ncbi:hypothetical protein NEOLEDRAFT_1060595 [Neolentinus lepideus HHB14362 ss-1]|uniref:BHLH domain-containing protein n=1 Tax=Neolentinus lepideus HHB14362 ss-1 TaxID=1314782 RepID=A0A165U3K3_9AGAM|nr:hypothetical protein NEOLEDRAFT_1060595 [Neolentinus lepideus HHB14362 ss-1]
MDQQHHQPITDEHNPALAPPYPFYQDEEAQYNIGYGQPIPQYQVVHPGPPPRQLSAQDLQSMQFRQLNLMPAGQYPGPVYNSPPQTAMNMPLSASPPPQSPNMYDPLSPPISGSDTSGDGIYMSRNSSGAGSPNHSRSNSLVHRNPLRYNPTPSPSTSSGRRSRGHSISDDDAMGPSIAETLASSRKEATRRQRIEAEQRRRDELRDGYAKLKDVLPVSNQKSSKVSLLERATNYIALLEKQNRELQGRVSNMEQEIRRLRSLNEKISLSGANDTPSPGQSMSATPMDSRPLSPPPESAPASHSLAHIGSRTPPGEESDGSDKDL